MLRCLFLSYLQCSQRGLTLEHYVIPVQTSRKKSDSCFNLIKNRQNLPKQPVPKLEDTLTRYLLSVRPLLNDDEYKKTVKIVKDFEKSCGPKLQELLDERATKHTNWLAEWWLNSAYLEYRVSVVVNSSPGLLMPPKIFYTQDQQLQYAANLVLGALKYKSLIDTDKIPLDKMGKYALDMAQYHMIFGTCRIPCAKRDRLCYNTSSRHIVVIHNNHLFRVDIYGADNKMLHEHQIICLLRNVVMLSACPNCKSVGVLTSDHRDIWANNYQFLSKDKENREYLNDIETSIFVLCLDAPVGLWNCDKDDYRRTIGGIQTIHGCGSRSNGCNRWFDKTIQFIVGADGVNGLTYEHSPAEGLPVACLSDYLLKYLSGQVDTGCASWSTCPLPPKSLNFNVAPEAEFMIADAKNNLDKSVRNLDMNCFQFSSYGKKFIKSQKLSPDSYLQMAMQLAYYRLYKEPGAHYESACTRMFVGGRTETIRSCSLESVYFAKTMLNSKCTSKEKIAALRTAVQSHKNYVIKALQGLGVDRHLLGLKFIAIENSMDLHELFSDVGFRRSGHWKMSTSQVALKSDGFMCYGAVVPDGYGICYNPRENDVNFAAAAFVGHPNTSASNYRCALEQSLRDMYDTLTKSSKC